jgi:transcriptional regulator with XRE-family HTH domain
MLNTAKDRNIVSASLNQHLGKKLRLRRTSLGLTQTQVAKAINVTFQQIQKYEKGTNGVSSARLLQLANFLKVPIKYFFEDFQDFHSENNQDSSRTSHEATNVSEIMKAINNLSSQDKKQILDILRNQIGIQKAI